MRLKRPRPPVDPKEAQAVVEPALRMLNREKGLRPIDLRNRLRRLMWEKVAVFRTEAGLKSALRDLEELRKDLEHQALSLKSRHFNQELAEGLENYSLVQVAQCVTEAALLRTESRGAHYRHDYPDTDNRNWLKHLVIRQSGHGLTFDSTPTDLSEIRPEGSF